ncbi:ROK domain protein [Leptospira borgpetersenii str. 200701203]|uniref:ROK domain protein n=1 Tax=Leptospira borgpetersenii str. 200701203 TaxID=1193007 RepID=M3H546_LEPBO|nr:ROK domain protein [Leptospira borgpetersenii str. 200701203]
MKSYLGIDIGAGSIKASLVAEDGTILGSTSRTTGAETDETQFLDSLADIVSEMKNSSLAAVGIGSPGPIDCENGILIQSANLPLLKNVALVDHLKKIFPSRSTTIMTPTSPHLENTVSVLEKDPRVW